MKQKLFIDFDEVIASSIKRFCRCYNMLYKNHVNFVPAEWWKTVQYDFKDTCPLIDNVHEIFDSELFFAGLELMNGNTYEVLEKLNNQYEVHIVSIGTFENLTNKARWIGMNLPFIEYAELLNTRNTMNKSIINMQGGILIDDVLDNLESSNAEFKFTFGDVQEWNEKSEYERLFNWTDIGNKLLLR